MERRLNNKVNKGQITYAPEVCIVTNGEHYEWAVVVAEDIYPTCIQAGPFSDPVNHIPATLVLNRDSATDITNYGKQVNILIGQGVLERNNYMAKDCPIIQDYCSFDPWWIGDVQELVTSQNIGQLEDNWEHNVCIGTDRAVRYITDDGIINTCTGYNYTEADGITSCEGANNWECGFYIYGTNQSLGFPIRQHRAIARALVQQDHTYPECSFKNRNYCNTVEQTQQPRYRLEDCVTNTHSNYHNSIIDLRRRIQNYNPDYDICYMADDKDILYYTIFVDGIGYPTCVQGPRDAEQCESDKYYCLTGESRYWPNTIKNRLLEGLVYGDNSRNNHMHIECPTLQYICQKPAGPNKLTAWQQNNLQPDVGVSGQFDNNLCLGRDGGLRVVTSQGVQPTCVGFHWDTSKTDDENRNTPCPAQRNFMCGTAILEDGRKTYGWESAQAKMIRYALSQPDFRHPQCPYDQCQDC